MLQTNSRYRENDGLRGALNGDFAVGAATDFAVLGLLAAIPLATGTWLFSKIEA